MAVTQLEYALLSLWAKLGYVEDERRYHPLVFHALDAAAVAEQLWRWGLTSRIHRLLADGLGLAPAVAERWVVFLTALHDFGKATPVFQFRLPQPRDDLERAAVRQVKEAGFSCPVLPEHACLPHGTLTSLVLAPLLRARGLSPRLACRLADTVAGHHGRFPDQAVLSRADPAAGDKSWEAVRRVLFETLASLLDVPPEVPQRADFPALAVLAGFVTVVDWIASISQPFFPYAAVLGRPLEMSLEDYSTRARAQARQAVESLRWKLPQRLPPGDFRAVFPALGSPRPVQQTVTALADRLSPDAPALVIIEAPTGEGKTEAAWLLADRWGITGSARGVYIGMPTRATGDALFDRIRQVLAHRYAARGTDTVVLQLVHGHAAVSAEEERVRLDPSLPAPEGLWNDGQPPEGRHAVVVAGEWFTYRKRGLLAPFGVGTVDQALLAALRLRHSFLRLFGLAGRVVVFDEVHAYDTYMLSLFERLLEWLAAIGSSVIVLSATLAPSRRAALAAAFRRGLAPADAPVVPLPEARYPRITVVTPDACSVEPVAASARSQRTIRLETLPILPDEDGYRELARYLADALSAGGCAAVVCNTVRQAQECFQALRPRFPGRADDGDPELDLLHARYPAVWRSEREQRVLRRFGKPGGTVPTPDGSRVPVSRPRRAVLVATQIVEQSLDLDFDLLLTFPAPIDLLLQRAGRLHRHQRETRPPSLAEPCVVLLGPPLDDHGVPLFDRGTLAIYDEHILLRTWFALRTRRELRMPEETDDLIAAVYEDGPQPQLPEALARPWRETAERLRQTLAFERNEAAKRWVCAPGEGRLEDLTDADLAEETTSTHPAFQALTRLGEPSVTLVPVFRTADRRTVLDPEGHEPVDLAASPNPQDCVRILRWSIEVGGNYLLRLLDESERVCQPEPWQRSPLLARVRVAWFDPDGSLPLARDSVLVLDRTLGLVTRKGTIDADL
ncbi:CRISPR-associated helicase Cas3' [Thermomicrobium sp.]